MKESNFSWLVDLHPINQQLARRGVQLAYLVNAALDGGIEVYLFTSGKGWDLESPATEVGVVEFRSLGSGQGMSATWLWTLYSRAAGRQMSASELAVRLTGYESGNLTTYGKVEPAAYVLEMRQSHSTLCRVEPVTSAIGYFGCSDAGLD